MLQQLQRNSPYSNLKHAADAESAPGSPVVLYQNTSNPFNPATAIEFSVDSSMPVRLSVFDFFRREIAVLNDGNVGTGKHSVQFDAVSLPSGVYICKLEANVIIFTRSMQLIR